jgi:heme O synthase-like polyprenyltransferase
MKYIKENWKTLLTSIILFILPIAAYRIEAASNIYIVATVLTTALFVYVVWQISQQYQSIKKSKLNYHIMGVFLFNLFLCICFGWWWLGLLWVYTSIAYFGVRDKQKNEVKGE